MKTTDAGLEFPVLGFTPDHEIWGFPDMNTLTSCGPRTLKDNLQAGMELVDAVGRRWRVRSIRRIGRGEPLFRWLIGALLTAAPQSRIEQDLEELSPVPLPDIKARAVASVQATADNYCNDDEYETVLEPLLGKVRAARNVAEITEVLGLDSFMAY